MSHVRGVPRVVAVTGGSGAIGSRLVRGLLSQGYEVRALSLPGDPTVERLRGLACRVFTGDVARSETLTDFLAGVDTVYHLAAVVLTHDYDMYRRVNLEGTRNVLGAATVAGVQHVIYISSASVVYPQTTPYSRSKRGCEALVRGQTGVAWTIVRPTLVYDRDGGPEFELFWGYLRRFPVVPFIGDGKARKRPVHVDDLVAGMLAIVGNPRTLGRTYHLCGGETVTIEELARLMLEVRGGARPFIRLPVALCQGLALAMRAVLSRPPLTLSAIAGLTQHADLDLGDAPEDLGYTPRGVRDGFRRTFGTDVGVGGGVA